MNKRIAITFSLIVAMQIISSGCFLKTGEEVFRQGVDLFNSGNKESAKERFIKACEKDYSDGCTFAMDSIGEDWLKNNKYSHLRSICEKVNNPNCKAKELINKFNGIHIQHKESYGGPLLSKEGIQKEILVLRDMTKLDLSKLLSKDLAFICTVIDLELNDELKSEARELLLECANRSDPGAMRLYADIIRIYDGHTAHLYYEKAALAGDSEAARATASDYFSGKGVAQNRLLALAWTSICASRGDETCIKAFNLAEKNQFFSIKREAVETLSGTLEDNIKTEREKEDKNPRFKKITCNLQRCDY